LAIFITRRGIIKIPNSLGHRESCALKNTAEFIGPVPIKPMSALTRFGYRITFIHNLITMFANESLEETFNLKTCLAASDVAVREWRFLIKKPGIFLKLSDDFRPRDKQRDVEPAFRVEVLVDVGK
jgi:hypothetical protein